MRAASTVEIIAGFPASVNGRVLLLDKDNLNTDGIYAGKHTYNDNFTPEQMAAVTFENFDPNFNSMYRAGDIVVGGLNFGTGSSREQAATALKFKAVPCVIASSFSETYKRNAFNNGFVVFECPEFVAHLRATLANKSLTTIGPEITIDYRTSTISAAGRHSYSLHSVLRHKNSSSLAARKTSSRRDCVQADTARNGGVTTEAKNILHSIWRGAITNCAPSLYAAGDKSALGKRNPSK